MVAFQRPVVLPVLRQHVEDAAALFDLRQVQLSSPHVQLHRLARLDERLAAHLKGLAVHGEQGLSALLGELAEPSAGKVFALSVVALMQRHAQVLTRVVALAAALPDAERGLLGALAWVSAQDLQGTVRALLGSNMPLHRIWGLKACAAHRVDPGVLLTQAAADAHPDVQAGAFVVAAQMGRADLADAARQALSRAPAVLEGDQRTVLIHAGLDAASTAPDPVDPLRELARSAAWALTLAGAGDHERVRHALVRPGSAQHLPPEHAHRLAVLAAPAEWAREQARQLAEQAASSRAHLRRMMRLTGWVGDPQVVPWLIHYMSDDAWARLAGESFALITGVDLAALDLERSPPEALQVGPNDDPADDDVALDEDDSLPWPDAAKVQAWWQIHAGQFDAGRRYFGGLPPSVAHCRGLLQTAGQRQRIMAAEYLCLLRPGTKLFPVAAPAWRQSRWLAEEEAALS